eukprot:gb/GECG01000620.1/.p1 GENE.gb/GECG01000620.1/~~gb/GECG01000620.1/.p1  ORF type:complete len:838 (+),score=93.33 gb/GECG01000620.1/:1-2514(+)
MSQKRGSRQSRSSLAPRDINLARELATAASGHFGDVLAGIIADTSRSVVIDERGGLKDESAADLKLLGALFVLLQVNISVEYLEVNGVDLVDEWVLKVLAAAISFNTTIHTLVLKNANLNDNSLALLTNSLKRNKTITDVTISGNPLGNGGTEHIQGFMAENKKVSRITLEENGFTDTGMINLANGLASSVVEELYIGYNDFAFGKEKFYDSEAKQMLRMSDILGRALKQNSRLRVLDLSMNKPLIKFSIAPFFDSLKFNESLRYLGLRGCKFTNRVFLTIAEFCVATKNTRRTIDLTNSGADARSMREVAALRVMSHDVSLKGVSYRGVANSDENMGQLALLVHLMNRPHGQVFPHSAKEKFVLVDGRSVTLYNNRNGQIQTGKVEYTHGDFLEFPMPPPSTLINKEEGPNVSYSSKTTRLKLTGTYTMHTSPVQKLMATAMSLMNLVDFSLDIAVLAQLGLAKDWSAFWIALGGLLWAILYTCYSLLGDGRRFAAFLHIFGFSLLLDAYYFVFKGKKPNSTIVLMNSQPMQGLAAIQRLKLLQALLEASPQILFQTFIVLRSGITVALVLSIALSFASVIGAATQSDRQKITAWSNSVEKTWVSTLSYSIFLFAAFRTLEVLSNIATVSLALNFFPFPPPITVAMVLGSKLVLIIIYWKGNVSQFGEVFSSVFISPGTERITYDWVKNVQRLNVWFYISVQIVYDSSILALLRVFEGVSIDDRLYFGAIGVVCGKYAVVILLWLMHNYCSGLIYTDRRHILTCGILKKKPYRGRELDDFTFKKTNPSKELRPSTGNWFKIVTDSSAESQSPSPPSENANRSGERKEKDSELDDII